MRDDAAKDNPPIRKKIFILGLVCFFLIIIMTLVFGKKGVMEIFDARRELGETVREVKKLEKDKAALQSDIRELEKDPRAVEKEARRNLWLTKPGEKTIVLPKDPKK
jgi:cell division protein FtsB